jgi:hypothetical protein
MRASASLLVAGTNHDSARLASGSVQDTTTPRGMTALESRKSSLNSSYLHSRVRAISTNPFTDSCIVSRQPKEGEETLSR